MDASKDFNDPNRRRTGDVGGASRGQRRRGWVGGAGDSAACPGDIAMLSTVLNCASPTALRKSDALFDNRQARTGDRTIHAGHGGIREDFAYR